MRIPRSSIHRIEAPSRRFCFLLRHVQIEEDDIETALMLQTMNGPRFTKKLCRAKKVYFPLQNDRFVESLLVVLVNILYDNELKHHNMRLSQFLFPNWLYVFDINEIVNGKTCPKSIKLVDRFGALCLELLLLALYVSALL